jgi:predicted molibdopterin-dependent oxidoreductase YjgC
VLFVVGSIDVVRVMGEDALASLGDGCALIVQDATRSPLTDRARVVLPGLTWAEKDGSFTNHAARVQRIRQAVEPPPGLVCDGTIFTRLHALIRADKPVGEFDPRTVLQEIAATVPAYAGLTFERLGSRGVEVGGRSQGAASDGAAVAGQV